MVGSGGVGISEWVSTFLRVLSPRRVPTIGLGGKNKICHNFAQRKKQNACLRSLKLSIYCDI